MKTLSEYPTPETDAHFAESPRLFLSGKTTPKMRNLEQRLAACREALSKIAGSSMTRTRIEDLIEDVLELTAHS